MTASNERNNVVKFVFAGRTEDGNGEGNLKSTTPAKRLNHRKLEVDA